MTTTMPALRFPPAPALAVGPLRTAAAIALGLGLVALITIADHLSGAQGRLAMFYLVPIALAAWLCGRVRMPYRSLPGCLPSG